MRIGLLLLALMSGSASAGEAFFTQQGRLTDSVGTPITGTHIVRVTLYADANTGTDSWRTVFGNVAFADGYYAVDITGADDSLRDLDTVLSALEEVYVGVAIDPPYSDLGQRQRVGFATGAESSPLPTLLNADGATRYTSATVSVTADDTPVVATGEADVEVVLNGVPTGSSAALADSGDTVALRLRSSGVVNGVAGGLLTVGSSAYPWAVETAEACVPGSQVFTHTGGPQTFTVPAACGEVTVTMWGAGGAGGTHQSADYGAAGGYTSGTVTTTAGESLSVVVGGGGTYPSGAFRKGGGGGGMSALLRGTDYLVVAGGGGGGSGCNAYGGAGGGLIGADGEVYNNWQGRGGTQGAGGAGGDNGGSSGSAGQGGQGYQNAGAAGGYGGGGRGGALLESGGGGGGGYYGGGGGGATAGGCGGGGGGGSSYVQGGGGILQQGSGQVPPETGSSDYAAGVGTGGGSTSGGHGRVVIRW